MQQRRLTASRKRAAIEMKLADITDTIDARRAGATLVLIGQFHNHYKPSRRILEEALTSMVGRSARACTGKAARVGMPHATARSHPMRLPARCPRLVAEAVIPSLARRGLLHVVADRSGSAGQQAG